MMKRTPLQIVLLVGFLVLASSAWAQKGPGGGGGGGGKDSGREGGRSAQQAPQRSGGGNEVGRAKQAAPNDARRAPSAVRNNVDRPKVAAPSEGRRSGGGASQLQRGTGNRGNAPQNPGLSPGRNADGTVNNLRRNEPRPNDPRLGNTRPDTRTAPRTLDRTDVRVAPRANVGDPRRNVAGSNAWRYRQYNNQWWYWLPNNSWVYWNNGAWTPYRSFAGPRYYDGPYVSGYRGTDSFAGGYLGVIFDPQYTDVAVISQVNANSPAEAAGLQPGDVIRAIGGDEVRSAFEPSNILRRYAPGTEVTLSVERDRQVADVAVVLGQR